jgi:hypothetical protein
VRDTVPPDVPADEREHTMAIDAEDLGEANEVVSAITP